MRRYSHCLIIVALAIFYCEFAADYVQLWHCHWPQLVDNNNPLHVLILSDTHLLGPLHGHWIDKLYREWHMQRAFQSALTLLHPEVVFVLGDLFDEGDLVNDMEYQQFVQRFRRHFKTLPDTQLISAVGNHDVGFHYRLPAGFVPRFHKQFNNTGVELYSFKDVHFVFINSMAMENDGCTFCKTAMQQLKLVAAQLDCLKDSNKCKENLKMRAISESKLYSRPVILQHFPTYRISDSVCKEGDASKIERFRENWEVLSQASTDMLGKLLNPRLAFAGHSHDYCYSTNRWGVDEYTVASFSWRNKVNPSFMLLTISADDSAVYKCNMLQQSTVLVIYMFAAGICCAVIICNCLRRKRVSRSVIAHHLLEPLLMKTK